ncbi:MAG: IclR family transcriptional regulator [Chloroflexi bacterium]|nr:IclR family transcriptional regulator [Chloroflexota bacterium]
MDERLGFVRGEDGQRDEHLRVANRDEDVKEEHRNGGIQVIARAVSILRSLRAHPEGLSLSQIAKEVGLPRSTVHRIIGALESERFIASGSANGRIRLGLGLVPLAAAVNIDLRRELRPYLERLYLEVNETIDLALLDEDHLLFVDQIAAPHRLRAVSGIGLSFPLYCTANGKAMLAELPDDDVERVIPERLEPLTAKTLTSRAQLMEELARVKVERVGFDREEHTVGICAVGAAIRDPLGRLAAISIPAPSIRFYGNEDRLAAALRETVDRIKDRFADM